MNQESPTIEQAAPRPAFPGVTASAEAQAYDFRNPMPLAPAELRRLRAHQEDFAKGLATRLSIQLGAEVSLKLKGLKTAPFENLAESWERPTHLTLFKMEPLRGVSVLEISGHMAMCMVDRLMGGPGQAPPPEHEISEIENVLLEQSVQLILHEWCGQWAGEKPLKPVILGYESDGNFIQSIRPDAVMLAVSMTVGFGDCIGNVQMIFPFAAVEALIRSVCKSAEAAAEQAVTPQPKPANGWKWNRCFDDVCVPVKAEWDGLEMTARQILGLKVGDVLPLNAQNTHQIKVLVADAVKFQGRPGTVGGQWAVQLTQRVNT